ncbi:hypothetical protein LshimejAT787_1100200 [Lyophyllum shimeji]|uniref:Uncharacterized protein n=1 Tax=Lyophyllum shimeji TaxID=47721 RepID=A0A9P3PU40_LYOSH|nr:hypothetical protein LshimejAT787_1100200 [Lyophyllum shimeji]
MGITSENLAADFNISRFDQDAFAAVSPALLRSAQEQRREQRRPRPHEQRPPQHSLDISRAQPPRMIAFLSFLRSKCSRPLHLTHTYTPVLVRALNSTSMILACTAASPPKEQTGGGSGSL